MSKQKQIDEMINHIAAAREIGLGAAPDMAEHLWYVGYRKQTEGEWIIKTDEYDCEYAICSVCKEEFYPIDADTVDTTPSYCMNCGAEMKGGEG
jgi:hypothetical protein